MVLGRLDIHIQKNQTGTLPYTIEKNNSKWIKDVNVRPKTIKLLKENIGGKLYDIGFGNHFLDMTPEAETREVKID